MTPTKEEQARILQYVQQNIDLFTAQSKTYREQMLQVYESLSTFVMPETWDVLTRFKINKAHEVVRKIVPRLIARSPRFLVSTRTDIFDDWDELKTWEDRIEMLRKHDLYAKATNDYLRAVFEDTWFRERLKYWAVNMITYWNSFVQVVPKFVIQKSKDWKWKVTEEMVQTLPTIDIASWTEMYYDPRYKILEDMPWLFRVRKRVRLQDILFTDWYFNLDVAKELAWKTYSDVDSYSQLIYSASWISNIKVKQGIDMNNLDLQVYEWKFSLTWDAKDERLYEIVTINATIVIWLKEITKISFVDAKWHEDPEVFYCVGVVAPIMWITDELNFQKNAQATAMSKSLNRSYYWSPESWVDPSNLIWDAPWNIIVCTEWVEAAKRNLEEQKDNPLPAQYFSNINDYNRDIQSLTHTTDVSSPAWQNALTNTATGARISFFESNAVIWEMRKNFEKAVQELAFTILDWTANNLDNNITLKNQASWEFIKVNIEAIKDAIKRYDIVIEANSSSFDDVENRRADALAVKNIAIEAAANWAKVDMDKVFNKVFGTFEWYEDVMKIEEEWGLGDLLWGEEWEITWKAWAKVELNPALDAAWLTKEVAWGNLSAI